MSEKEIKIFVVGSSIEYASFINNNILVDKLENADIVLFTGGEDVSPELYGDKAHPTTSFSKDRDIREKKIFESVHPDQLCLGICRGSQFLCVMNGGKLIQNVYNHSIKGTHPITNGEISFEITSTHHQMQMPYLLDKNDYEVLFYSKGISEKYDCVDNADYGCILVNEFNSREPEIVLYHKKGFPKCLAVQGHPEYMDHDSDAVKNINLLIKKYLN